jgi:general secretion pathway protein C
VADRATTPREWALAVAGGLALSGVLVWVLRAGEGEEPVVLNEPVAQTAALPAPVPPPTAAPALVTAPVTAAPVDLKLRGLIVRPGTAASAIVESGDGSQRLVRVGSAVSGGARVESIDASGVVIASRGGRQRLAMIDTAAQPESAPAPAASAPLKALAASANDYRLAMKPRKVGGQTTGYVITDTTRLPAFRMAGMQPGDVLISVNGTGILSEEKLLEMPAEIAGAYAVDVVFERGGQRRRGVVTIQR